MALRVGVSYGSVPFSIALFTCRCGAEVTETDMKRPAPEGWVNAGDDVHLCPGCARTDEARLRLGETTP
jgi:hypothetical protein